jgi:hypothetical protein
MAIPADIAKRPAFAVGRGWSTDRSVSSSSWWLSLLHELSVFQHQNAVHIADGREAVGNDDGRAVFQ